MDAAILLTPDDTASLSGRIAPLAADVARIFYRELFELDPTLRTLFVGNLERQGDKLMQMIGDKYFQAYRRGESAREAIFTAAEARMPADMLGEDGIWRADYVRLRFSMRKVN